MIVIKDAAAQAIMQQAGVQLASVFDVVAALIKPGVTTLDVDRAIERELAVRTMQGSSKGYQGYAHVSCVSVNDEVIHAIPSNSKLLRVGDVVKVDVCASWRGYCVDMARTFLVENADETVKEFVRVAYAALDAGIVQAIPGKRLSDISHAIEQVVRAGGYGVVRDYAGHGVGAQMHEAPEIANYGRPGRGPVLQEGMTLAIEPMITLGDYRVRVESDGWTVKTVDQSLAAHVEDTVLITKGGPVVLTRPSGKALYV